MTTKPRDGSELSGLMDPMCRALAHRGPDARGSAVVSPYLVLGHTRLAVIDLTQAGEQPMSSGSGRWCVTFNGEIYNYRNLRRELQSEGVRFKGASDTEVLVEALDRWGLEASLRRFDGMFAFGAYDKIRHELYLVRDRFGEKPLYYGNWGEGFFFSSELGAYRAAFPGCATPDAAAIDALFHFGYVPAPRTIYQGVLQVPPGSWLRLDVPGGERTVSRWWDPVAVAASAAAEPWTGSEEDAAGELTERLTASTESRLVADVPVGAFLSGGIDSSLVVATLVALGRNIRTYAIGFDDAAMDESVHARAVAAHLGTDHHDRIVTEVEALNVIRGSPGVWDQPIGDPSYIPTYLVSELARSDVTVILSGDGGDELFGGYERYRMLSRMLDIRRRVQSMGLRGPVRSIAQTSARFAHRFGFGQHGRRLAYGAAVVDSPSEAEVYRYVMDWWPLRPMVDRDLDVVSRHRESFAGVDRALALDTSTYLTDDILMKVDRAAMASSLESRIPFLHPDVFEFAWSLPAAMRWQSNTGKSVLRTALGRYLPSEVFSRPKQGFGIPIHRWLRTGLRAWADELIESGTMAGDPFDSALRQAWREHIDNEVDNGYQLWPALTFAAWRRHHHPEW